MIWQRKWFLGFFLVIVVFGASYLYWPFLDPMWDTHITEGSPPFIRSDHVVTQFRNYDNKRPFQNNLRYKAGEKQIHRVLLVTYYRGGSTFLGESFNQNPDCFYWFEPLHEAAYEKMRTSMDAIDIYQHNKTTKRLLPLHDFEDVARNLANIFNCNLASLNRSILIDYFVTKWEKSVKLLPYKACMEELKNDTLDDFPQNAVQECLPLAVKACKSSPIRVIKIIRIGLYMLPTLSKMIPELHVVFYVRDPRGMILSRPPVVKQANVSSAIRIKKKSESESLCFSMHEDFLYFNKLRELNQLNIHLVKYEDLAVNTMKTLSDIHENLSLALPSKVTQWFGENIHAHKDNSFQGTTRANSTATAYRWRHIFPKDLLPDVNADCEKVLDDYGYSI